MEPIGPLTFAGDWHGNTAAARYIIEHAGGDTVVQLGDFGIWSGKNGLEYLEAVSTAAQRYDKRVFFILGNHEDYDLVKVMQDECPKVGPFFQVAAGVCMIPNGAMWTWNGCKFGALGGAYSIDRRRRTLGVSWFKEEVPTWAQANLLQGDLDVLLTHDAPDGVDLVGLPGVAESDQVEARKVRHMIGEVVARTKPTFVIHGHWHQAKISTLPYADTQVLSLAHELNEHSVLQLELGEPS